MNNLFMLADGIVSPIYPIVRLILLISIVLCSLFLIVVILIQPGNSSGIGALGGSSETFLSKNKSKTAEGRKKRTTVTVAILLGVLAIAFAIVSIITF